MKRIVPWAILALSALYLAAVMSRSMPAGGGFDFAQFGRLPVFMDGRVQPVESAARSALLRIRGTSEIPLADGRTLASTEWLLEVLANPDLADERSIFPVDDADLRRELDSTPEAASALTYYAFKQIAPRLDGIRERAERIDEVRMTALLDALIVYQRLKNGLQPNTFLQQQTGGKPVNYDIAAALARHQDGLPAGAAAWKAREHGAPFDRNALTAMMNVLQPYEMVARVGLPLFIPPADPANARDGWVNFGVALRDSLRSGEVPAPMTHVAAMSTAFTRGRPAEFNRHVSEYQEWLGNNGFRRELRQGTLEVFYVRLRPSIGSAALYVGAVVIGLAFWMTRSTTLYRSALTLCGLAFALHTAELVVRAILENRPPLTNAYSSTLVIAWVIVALGVGVESFRRTGTAVITSALAGVLALIAARALAPNGDVLEAIRATLNSTAWLTAHVGMMTLGYATVFLAGFVAAAYILLGVLTRLLSSQAAKEMDRLVYRLISLAALFITAGAMAGGFWADRVWGRFWGWDPKENGALLMILWTVIYLQVRSNRLAGERAQMILAVGGTIVATVSWIGVNMLGVGLHSYGFMAKEFGWLAWIVTGQLAVVGLGSVPLRHWRSRQPRFDTPLEHRPCADSPLHTPIMSGNASSFAEARSITGT